LNDIPKNATLEFSYIGMETKSVQVTDKGEINVILSESSLALDEVVVVGYFRIYEV
jgi:hypothetical protein